MPFINKIGGAAPSRFADLTSGKLFAWGTNAFGRVGNLNTTVYSSPVQVRSATNWVQAGGSAHGQWAVNTDGKMYSWGIGQTHGSHGQNTTGNFSSPHQLGTLTTWNAKLSSDAQGTMVMLPDGKVWIWGRNEKGQLGLGDTTARSSPVQIGSLTDWNGVTGSSISKTRLVIKDDATLWGWGLNTSGQLGNGAKSDISSPVQIGSLTTWISASTGYTHSGGVTSDGKLWMTGDNTFGKLGIGNTTDYSSPKQVGSLTNWIKVAVNNHGSLALKTDGTVWWWGRADYLGNGPHNNTTNLSSPVQIGSSSNWTDISMQNWHGFIQDDAGQVFGWGLNNHGCLGRGNTTTYSSPVQVATDGEAQLKKWTNPNDMAAGEHSFIKS